ncbi:MAG: TetR family transcriptional regulator C-terminal domain-containing protein [Nitrospirota bacterium]
MSPRQSAKREQIIEQAAKLVHLKGFHHTSVDDILEASGAGKGQFYHYFQSKNELGLAIIDWGAGRMRSTLLEKVEQGQGLEAIQWMLRCVLETARAARCNGGCPLGNLAAEMSDVHEPFRRRLAEVFESWRAVVARTLAAAQRRGEIGPDADVANLSSLILSTVEGAILLAKVQHDARVMERSFEGLWECMKRWQA